jgi:hypothetical protein
MAVRTEQSNVSSRHHGADYMRQAGGKVGCQKIMAPALLQDFHRCVLGLPKEVIEFPHIVGGFRLSVQTAHG